MTIKFQKVSEDSYQILADGKVIGEVYKAWTRDRGKCWQVAAAGKPRWFSTRKEAARVIAKERTCPECGTPTGYSHSVNCNRTEAEQDGYIGRNENGMLE